MSTAKPALILIHGFRGSPLGLEAIANELKEQGYSVYLPPTPPFAGAEPLCEYSPRAYANYVKQYIIKNHISQPILIGHSMGSIIAAATASYYPELLNSKLVLLAPISVRPSRFFAFLSPLCSFLPRRMVDYITTRYLYTHQPTPQAFKKIMHITSTCSATHPPARKDNLNATKFSAQYCVNDFSPQKDISIIVGEHDHLIPRQKTVDLAKRLHAKTTFLPGCGHLHNYEKPHETAQAIIHALES